MAAMAQAGARELLAPATYRVVHAPFVFVRAAPSTDAEVVSLTSAGSTLTVDAECDGWVRRAATAADEGPAGGWVLVDGAALGLGVLLQPVTTPLPGSVLMRAAGAASVRQSATLRS